MYTISADNLTTPGNEIALSITPNASVGCSIKEYFATTYDTGSTFVGSLTIAYATVGGATPTNKTAEKINSRSSAALSTTAVNWTSSTQAKSGNDLVWFVQRFNSEVLQNFWRPPNPRNPIVIQPSANPITCWDKDNGTTNCARWFIFNETQQVKSRRETTRSRVRGFSHFYADQLFLQSSGATNKPGRSISPAYANFVNRSDWPDGSEPTLIWNINLYGAAAAALLDNLDFIVGNPAPASFQPNTVSY